MKIEFDENGDPKYNPYSIVFWNNSGDAEEVGFYKLHPSVHFFINNSKIQWHMKGEVLEELKKSNFTLLNMRIEFDGNGDPKYNPYSIVFWNDSGDAEEVGFYKLHPSVHFFINNSKIQWHMKGEVLEELKKSNFTLLNTRIEFDENGDPKYNPYSIVFWNDSGDAEEVGFYKLHPSVHFFINNSKIQWHMKGESKESAFLLR
ncbi:hypothetical protein D5F01_LYC08396 [Larimichthys crocea]|uniref:Uncharacterized protein n=1 Tax=Larimichthys crocea TaxID=215358 RepID=A0A6G0IP36_LARCR|nr:hypothetical protein D5F01_LYC08396 [Larimichthys crocea]